MVEDRDYKRTLRRSVAEMVALEGELEGALDHQREELYAHPEAAAVVRHFREMASTQREALEAHLERLGDDTSEPTGTAVAALFDASRAQEDGVRMRTVSSLLRDDYCGLQLRRYQLRRAV